MKKTIVTTALFILALTLILCACAKEITEVKITFDGNGGTAPEEMTVSLSEAEDTVLPVATRTDYRFCGWYFDAEQAETFSIKTLKEKQVAEITLYAKWEPLMRRLVFDGKGGTTPNGLILRLSEADSITLPTSSRQEYHFIGWTFDEAGQDAYSVEKLREKGEDEIMLYAQWGPYTENERITIHGLTDGKTTVNPSFDWNNLHNDSMFRIALTDESGALVTSTGTSVTHFEVARYL